MQKADIPVKMPVPFGQSAGGSFIRTVPIPSQILTDPGAASFTTGFTPDTFADLGAGGVPPDGKDFNGLFNAVTAWNRWQQAGVPAVYDSSFSADVGGYPEGAIVQSATTARKYWLSTADDNTTDPDAAGAGWLPFFLPPPPITGSCRFLITSGAAVLEPFNGNTIYVPGTGQMEIAAAGGVSFAVGATLIEGGTMAVGSKYYAYVSDDGAGAARMRPSATGHTTDPDTGVEVRIGSAADALVGQVLVSAGPAFSTLSLGCLSWFNRQNKVQSVPLTSDQASAAGAFTEINSAFRNTFLSWSDEFTDIQISGQLKPDSTVGVLYSAAIGVNSTTVPADGAWQYTMPSNTGTFFAPVAVRSVQQLTEIVNYATLLGGTQDAAHSVRFQGTAGQGTRTVITVAGRG